MTPAIQPVDPNAPTASADSKDMESFRKMEDTLSSQINSLGLLRLGVMLLLRTSDPTAQTSPTGPAPVQPNFDLGSRWTSSKVGKLDRKSVV